MQAAINVQFPRPLVPTGTDIVGEGDDEIREAPYQEKRLTPARRQDFWLASDMSKGQRLIRRSRRGEERRVIDQVGRILVLG